jgi:hypothetical protein
MRKHPTAYFAHLSLLVMLCLHLSSFNAGLAQSYLVDRPERSLLATVSIKRISRDNQELAEQLKIWPMLCELYNKEEPPNAERTKVLRDKIRETIFECYFDAESVEAEAHREQGNIEAMREALQNKRDRAVEINNGSNFIAAGTLNTIGSVLGFSARTPPFPGNVNQMLSGVVAAAMSTYALKQGSGGKTFGQGQPTVLAELFGRPCDERTTYPESVWRFLHGKSPEDPAKTRVQLLEERWMERHYLEKYGSHRAVLKVDLVCGVRANKKCMTLDDLNDEINMIDDISGMASLMSHHLRDIMAMTDSDIADLPQ